MAQQYDQALIPIRVSPRQRGYRDGWKPTPGGTHSPYKPGTPQCEEWQAGFREGAAERKQHREQSWR